jgi:hypothetical protein
MDLILLREEILDRLADLVRAMKTGKTEPSLRYYQIFQGLLTSFSTVTAVDMLDLIMADTDHQHIFPRVEKYQHEIRALLCSGQETCV